MTWKFTSAIMSQRIRIMGSSLSPQPCSRTHACTFIWWRVTIRALIWCCRRRRITSRRSGRPSGWYSKIELKIMSNNSGSTMRRRKPFRMWPIQNSLSLPIRDGFGSLMFTVRAPAKLRSSPLKCKHGYTKTKSKRFQPLLMVLIMILLFGGSRSSGLMPRLRVLRSWMILREASLGLSIADR